MLPPGVRRGYPEKFCLPLRFPKGRAGGVGKGGSRGGGSGTTRIKKPAESQRMTGQRLQGAKAEDNSRQWKPREGGKSSRGEASRVKGQSCWQSSRNCQVQRSKSRDIQGLGAVTAATVRAQGPDTQGRGAEESYSTTAIGRLRLESMSDSLLQPKAGAT